MRRCLKRENPRRFIRSPLFDFLRFKHFLLIIQNSLELHRRIRDKLLGRVHNLVHEVTLVLTTRSVSITRQGFKAELLMRLRGMLLNIAILGLFQKLATLDYLSQVEVRFSRCSNNEILGNLILLLIL